MAELIETGLIIMLVGMGVVCAMLTLLIYAVNVMSRVSNAIDAVAAASAPAPSPGGGLRRADDDEIAGVIAAAIRMHRRKR